MVSLAEQSLTVHLDPDAKRRLSDVMERGLYGDASEVIGYALKLLEGDLRQREFESRLRRAYEASEGTDLPFGQRMTAFLESLGDHA